VKERLYGFTREEIFGKKVREETRGPEPRSILNFQINRLTGRLEREGKGVEALKERILLSGEPYMTGIDILTGMKGVSVFIAIAVIADIIEVGRFKGSGRFASYLRPAPRAANSNGTVKNRGEEQEGEEAIGDVVDPAAEPCDEL
jgi:hypothetical protein